MLMKYLIAILLVTGAVAPSPAAAATLTVRSYPNNVYALYLRGESTVFNAVELTVTPAGSAFQNTLSGVFNGAPRPPGQPFTYRNRALDADPYGPDLPGIGKGWSLGGVVNTSTKLSFAGGPLGQDITTATEPNGELFLANIMLEDSSSSATAVLRVLNGFASLPTQILHFPLPEPTTAGMGVMSLLGLMALRPSRREDS